jgi:hypothetical protein
VNTLLTEAHSRIKIGSPMPGVFAVSQSLPVRKAIEEILLLAECSLPGEWEGQVRFLPL